MRARQIHDRYASLTWLIVVMTIVVLATGTIAARYVESRLIASKGESLALAAAEIAHKLDLLLAERYSDVRALAQNPLLRGHDAAAKNTYLDSLRTISPLYLLLGVTDAQGRFVAATDRACIGMDMSRSPWFQAARGTRRVHVGDVEPFEEAGGTDAISFTAPIEGAGGEFQGTVTTRVGLPLLEEVVARTIRTFQTREESGGNLEYKFVTSTGAAFIDSDLFHKGNVNLKQLGLPSALLGETGQPRYFEEEHLQRHVPVITGYARTQGVGEFPGLKWTVLLRTDKGDLVAPIRNMLWKLAAAWVFIWLPMLGFLFWSAGRLKKERASAQDEQAHATMAESKYRQLVDQARDIIYRTDTQGRCTFVNPIVTRIMGYSPQELIGLRFDKLIRPDARASAERFYGWQSVRKTPSTYYEFPALTKDGREIWIGQNVQVLLENGEVTGFHAVARDITERKRAEEARRESEMQIRLFMEATADCIWNWDLEAAHVTRNVGFERLFGYAAEEIAPTIDWWAERLHPDDRERVWAAYGDAVANGRTTCTYEYRFRRGDGSYAVVSDHAFIVRNDTGKVVRALGAMTDITERKRVEEALMASEKRLRTILEAEPECVKVTTEDGVLLSMNAAGLAMIEADSLDQVVGQSVCPLIVPTDRDAFTKFTRRVYGGEPGTMQFEVIGLKGRHRWMDTHAIPLRDERNATIGVLAITRDVTDRKREENIMQALLEGTASVTGGQFFPALVRALASAHGVRHALVTELLEDKPSRVRMLAIWMGDRLGNPTEYDLIRTPCEKVVALGEAYYQHSVQELFPDDKDLVALGAVSYLGIAMKDSSGKTIGHLCILDDKPLPDKHQIAPLLKIFASRAAAELERKLVDEALRESEKRFRTIFDQAPLGMAVINSTSGQFRRINRTYCNVVGYSHKEMLTRTFQDITHPDDLQADLDNMTRMMEGRIHTFRMEKRYIRKDGAIVWVNLVCVPLWWDYETEGRFHIAMVEDITERKRTEEVQEQLVAELAESRSRFEMFFRQTPSAIAITTLKEGRFLDLNKEAEILTGYSRAELIGRTTQEMNLYVDPAERTAVVQQVKKTGMLTDLERLIRNKSGEIRTAVFSLVPIQMGSEPCLLSIAHDITERKRAEAALRERSRQQAIEAELSLLAVTTPGLLTLLNTASGLAADALDLDYCEVLELLPNGRDLLLRAGVGWKNDLIGQARTDMGPSSLASMTLHMNDPVIVQDLPAETRFNGPSWLRDHGIVSGISVTIHSKEGHWGTLGVYTTRQRRFSRDDVNFLQTVSSILATAIERAQAEDVLRNANEALRRLSRQLLQVQEEDRRAIARDLHDEIGQSLTAIKLNVERAQRTADRTAQTRIMRDCGQITDNVLEQVRDLSLNLHPSILDDLGLAYALKWYADRQAERADLKIQVAADLFLPRLSHDIEIACFRIAQEALTNVVRHAKASRASVTLKRGTTSVELAILDDGVGFVVDAVAPPTTGKASIGLTSMQERARLVGGEIKIASVPTQGTEVIATLPLASSAEAPATEAAQS